MRFDKPREGGGGASPKMKNLMKAPMRRTTDSWPSKNPCVKERLVEVSLSSRQFTPCSIPRLLTKIAAQPAPPAQLGSVSGGKQQGLCGENIRCGRAID